MLVNKQVAPTCRLIDRTPRHLGAITNEIYKHSAMTFIILMNGAVSTCFQELLGDSAAGLNATLIYSSLMSYSVDKNMTSQQVTTPN